MIDNPFMWRKGLFLSATFLFSIFLFFACKKKENLLGNNVIDQNQLLSSAGVDTFSLRTFNYFDDSIISDNAAFGLLGSYVDPVFGRYNAEIYTQFRLEGLNPDFGDINTIVVDSFVLAMKYVNIYGTSGPQTFEVYELGTDLHLDSTYYSFTTIPHANMVNLIQPGKETVEVDPNAITVVGNDTLSSQLRLHLSTSKGKSLLIEAMSGSNTFATNEDFLTYFKGLHIRTNNIGQSSGDGAVGYFSLNDPASKLILYYTQGGEQKTFSFLINSSCADFNHVDIDNTMTAVETVNNDTISGQVQFYAQSYGSRAVVQIPGISNIPSTAVIHSAVLELPVAYQTGNAFSPGFDISVATRLVEGSTDLYSVNTTGTFSSATKSFRMDLRAYVQAIVNKEVPNSGLILSPLLHSTSADRIVFNGPNTTNKSKPKISILYTDF